MFHFARPQLTCFGLLCFLLTANARATSINFVGVESGEAVVNWSNDEVEKGYDANGTERFGNAGFYQITPGALGDTWSDSAGPDNDLGITQIYPTLYSKPDFLIENPLGTAGSFSNPSTAPFFMNPEADSLIRLGALQPNFENLVEGSVPGGNEGTDIDGFGHIAFTFKLGAAASFRIGIAVDTSGSADNSVDFVSIRQTGSSEVFSDQLQRDATPDMVFFDIDGNADDEFTVTLWLWSEPYDQPVVFSLITFDLTPNATPTLTYEHSGNHFTLSWQPEITGWTLESSIDLGAQADWTPVTNPPVVNNSVTLNIIGTPQNFFRLRKDP